MPSSPAEFASRLRDAGRYGIGTQPVAALPGNPAAFHGRAQRCTLYASSGHIALKASKLVNGYARAGEAGDSLVIVDGAHTIDATRVDTSLIGLRHSYFGSKRSILRDIAEIMMHRKEPSLRFELKEV